MAVIAKDSGGGDFTPAPQGSHAAVCIQVIDMGTIHSKWYDSWAHKVLVGFEIDERDENDKRFLVWKRYTLSLSSKSHLRHHLESWRGRGFTPAELEGFDLKNILGKPCLVSIKHDQGDNKTTYANITGVSGLPKQMEAPKAEGDLIYFDVDNPDMEVFKTFSENLQKTIRGCKEWSKEEEVAAAHGDTSETMDADDIPF